MIGDRQHVTRQLDRRVDIAASEDVEFVAVQPDHDWVGLAVDADVCRRVR